MTPFSSADSMITQNSGAFNNEMLMPLAWMEN